MMPLEFVGCIGGCDETLREVLDLKYLRAGGSGGGAGNGRGGKNGGGGRGRVGGGGGRGRGHGPHPLAPKAPRAPNSNAPFLPPVPTWTPQPRQSPQGFGVSVNSDSDIIVCNCGQQALLLTVRKDGPNQGRQFYKCNGGTCDFFLWADQPRQEGASQRRDPPLQPPRTSLRFPHNSGNAGQNVCSCGESPVTRTVQKDGPNKGRMFHACGKSREQQCGFFQWADENAPPSGSSFYQCPGVNIHRILK